MKTLTPSYLCLLVLSGLVSPFMDLSLAAVYPGYYNSGSAYSRSRRMPLISLEMDPHKSLNTSFRVAIREGRLRDAKQFLRQGAEVNSGSESQETALMYAAQRCLPDAMRFLLKNKAHVNDCDSKGRTALILAVQGSCAEAVVLLLEAPGVQTGIRDLSGSTAEDYALDAASMDVDGPAVKIVRMIQLKEKRAVSSGSASKIKLSKANSRAARTGVY